MASSRSTRRVAAITRRQRVGVHEPPEFSMSERRLPVAPLPPELAATAAADRGEAAARRTAIVRVRRDIEQQRRIAKESGDIEQLARLDAFSRHFEAEARLGGSLDRFAS